MTDPIAPRWLLLIHQIPPKPDYFRVKIWRRLQRLGAVALKNSVYVLPRSDQALEDFQWVLREIAAGGGDAMMCEVAFIEGLTDGQVESLFHEARGADYERIAAEARRLLEAPRAGRRSSGDRRLRVRAELDRLKKRLAEVAAIDHLGAPARATAERAIDQIERQVRTPVPAPARGTGSGGAGRAARGRRVWVTRQAIHVDRMACGWLIRRFIDSRARFKFVPAAGYRPGRGEVRFDMFEAEFTHEGDRCTFEVLVEKFSLKDPALRPIAEIVHDIDLKDARYHREETAGIARLVAGIAMAHRDDRKRLARGAALFDDLYAYFHGKGA